MKRKDLLAEIQIRLEKCGIENARTEAKWLFQKALSLSENEWLLARDESGTPEEEARLESMVSRRLKGEPIQYILGEWPFLSLELSVGPGVLIPRPETEMLCEKASEKLSEGAKVLDLCAGSGAVGLGICSLRAGVEADCVELSEEAFAYLVRNIGRYSYPVRALRYDVHEKPDAHFGCYDLIAANPPYVAQAEMNTLPREVAFEPEMALCGGADGLIFYRSILENWLPLLRSGGWIFLEIGENQGMSLRQLLKESGLADIQIFRDFSGQDRIAAARKED